MVPRPRHSSPSFVSFPSEIREMIYEEFFKQRIIVLSKNFRKSEHHLSRGFRLTNPDPILDNSIALLLTCRKVLMEARAFFHSTVPSHLVFDSLPGFPTYSDYVHQPLSLTIPYDHIIRITLTASGPNTNSELSRRCPMNYMDVDDISRSFHNQSPHLESRLPNFSEALTAIESFPRLFPALKEVCIYGTLRHEMLHVPEPCLCSLAGSNGCICSGCECRCVPSEAQLLRWPTHESWTELTSDLYRRLHARFRWLVWSVHFGGSDIMVKFLYIRGIKISLREAIDVAQLPTPIPMIPHGLLTARYHLAPSTYSEQRATPPTQPATSYPPRLGKMGGIGYSPVDDVIRSAGDCDLFNLDICTIDKSPMYSCEAGLDVKINNIPLFDMKSSEGPTPLNTQLAGRKRTAACLEADDIV